MRILLALIEIFGAIKLCASFPVTAVAVGEQNAFMLGTVTFFIFGIAIVGCVCCRRRKKGFELDYETDQKEFQNESGTIDGNKTEYPIFRALSPDNNQRNDSSLNPNVITVNNSNENLIGDDNDNNNGPISPADLENIENNNAAHYIQNQNEIINLRLSSSSSLPPSPSLSLSSSPQQPTSSQLLENENFVEIIDEKIYTNHNNYDNYHNNTNTNNDVIISSSSSSSIKNNMTINSNALKFSDHDDLIVNINNNNNDNISNEKKFINSNKTPNFDTTITTTANNHHHHHHHQNTKNFYNTNFTINNTVTIINEKFHSHNNTVDLPKIFDIDHKINTNNIKKNTQEDFINIKSDISQYNEKQRNCHEIIEKKEEQIDETSSVVSNGTSKSNDDNSVEEALRVLDDAIKGEEYDIDLDENNDIYDEDFNENSSHFQYVIQQLLINNSIEDEDDNVNSDGTEKNIKKSLIGDNDDNKEIYLKSIRNVAETLIDSIMKESEKIAEIRKCEQFNNELKKLSDTFNIENVISQNLNDQILSPDQIINFKRSKSLENFFIENIETSTPCVHNKYAINNENNIQHSYNKFSKKCLNNLFETKTNDLSPEILTTTKIIKKSLSPIDLINNENEFENDEIIEHKIIVTSPIENRTFEINNVTYDLNNEINYYDDNNDEKNEKNSIQQMNFIHPGDPCTSRQALERDCCRNRYNFDEDINSDDLTTLTPLNTPIELNYPYDTWNKMMQQQQQQNQQQKHQNNEEQENLEKTSNNMNNYDFRDENQYLYPQINDNDVDNETFDVDDDDYNENDEANLQSTFEALKKQLAEILPQPQQQSLTGPPEYSDDEQDDNESNRTFDEYRSPLDGIIGLLEAETSSSSSTVQNEVFINYKRSLSPIMEESEEETCKTFVMNETKCLDSTSSGCVETGEAIMGVTKTLMASNDTLFNFEDTLGEKEDVFSPRIPSRSDIQSTTIKSGISTGENSIATPTESSDTEKGTALIIPTTEQFDEIIANGINNGRRTPPKTIDFIGSFEIKQDSELCSPDQQKTFSEGTSSTDRVSSDISPTVDHDTTFTTNTIDDKTCVTVIIKDDERISEISEPEWGSTASYGGGGGCDLNSLTDIPSLDFNVNNFEDDEKLNQNNDFNVIKQEFHDDNRIEKLNSEENISSSLNDIERDSYHDDSGHSTQASITDDMSTGQQQQQQQNYPYEKISNINDETLINSYINKTLIQNETLKEQCEDFLINEINYSSPNQKIHEKLNNLIKSTTKINDENLFMDNNCIDHPKENNDPNITNDLISTTATITTTATTTFQLQNEKNLKNPIINQKVQIMNDIDDNDKIHHNDTVIAGKMTYTSILTTDNLEKEIIDTYNDVMIAAAKNRKQQNEQNDVAHQLSGEEDPWIEPLKPRTSEICNEWDSDVDDSHSSEEFMYIRGSPSKEDVLKILNSNKNDENAENLNDKKNEYVNCNETDIIVWSSNNDNTNSKPKKIKKNSTDDEISEEESSSEEFVPSCWNSMAIPARSALKSPDKPVNEIKRKLKNKKNRNVAFKKQRYHSVYEYPKETTSLSSSYSESSLWNRNSENSLYFDTTSQKEEFSDGFTVSSSMRPFHGCQFNALCHTWPIDSDFSWSQIIEELDSKPLVTYSDTDMKSDEDDITKNKVSNGGDNKRPDSGVGESAEMLSDRTTSVGELCHTKSSLHLPLEQIPTSIDTKSSNHTTTIKLNNDLNNKDSQLFTTESIVLPTPSCTGSMDSLSSNSSSERQTINFTTFGKFNKKTNNDKDRTSLSSSLNNDLIVVNGNSNNRTVGYNGGDGIDDDNYEPSSMITTKIIMNGGDSMIENNLKVEKIRQSDSTDEDSGIESIVKVNNK